MCCIRVTCLANGGDIIGIYLLFVFTISEPSELIRQDNMGNYIELTDKPSRQVQVSRNIYTYKDCFGIQTHLSELDVNYYHHAN